MAKSESDLPKIDFAVEIGSEDTPRLKIMAGDMVYALPLTTGQAAELGHALLSASVACHQKPTGLKEGTVIRKGYLPIVRWAVGYSRSSRLPVAHVEIRGGTKLVFTVQPNAAEQFGLALARLAHAERAPNDPVNRDSPAHRNG